MTIFGIRDYLKDVIELRKNNPTDDQAQGFDDGNGGQFVGGPNLSDLDQRRDEGDRSDRALQINLVICNVTVWIMFVVAVIELAFAALMQDELKEDT